jgi:hypothetical protein
MVSNYKILFNLIFLEYIFHPISLFVGSKITFIASEHPISIYGLPAEGKPSEELVNNFLLDGFKNALKQIKDKYDSSVRLKKRKYEIPKSKNTVNDLCYGGESIGSRGNEIEAYLQQCFDEYISYIHQGEEEKNEVEIIPPEPCLIPYLEKVTDEIRKAKVGFAIVKPKAKKRKGVEATKKSIRLGNQKTLLQFVVKTPIVK